MKIKILSALLVLVGLLQSAGYLLDNKTVKQLGLITVASPLPIVFTQQKGFLETFALDFTFVYEQNNTTHEVHITPELYTKLDKPYNYRNVLGAAISYGPILPKPLVSSVLDYAFIEPGEFTRLFNIAEFDHAFIRLVPKTCDVNQSYILPIGESK